MLRAAVQRAEVLGIGGGDGTVADAADAAVDGGRPLAVFPAGTFNHFAKDIGCDDPAKTVQAIREGSVSCVYLVCFNDDTVVINTASIGAYPAFVRTHESLERKIGKPPGFSAHQERSISVCGMPIASNTSLTVW